MGNSISTSANVLLQCVSAFSTSLPVKVIKWIAILLVAINYRSFPLLWHFRSLLPLYMRWFQYTGVRARLLLSFKSKAQRVKAADDWLDSLHPVGKNPFEVQASYRSYASLDESDYNMHLSNSSYAKTLDRARFDAAMIWFTNYVRAGCLLPLGGTHFHYIREIPILASFEVRTSIGAWDEKWVYIVSKFVSHPKKGSKKKVAPPSKTPGGEVSGLMHPPIQTPAGDLSSSATTPELSNEPTDLKKLAAKLAITPEPDGATLHTVCVSEFCFKIGRITIPPAVVMASSGFTGADAGVYSHVNPPPHYERVKKMLYTSSGGGIKAYREFLKGGWKQDRWWEAAMSGTEEQRKARYETVFKLRSGMDGTRTL